MTKTNKSSPALSIGIFWLLITLCLLLLVSYGQIKPGIEQILTVVAGMSLAAAFSALQNLAELRARPVAVAISFNEVLIRESLAGSYTDHAEIPQTPNPEWELTPIKLVGLDKTLALAKLRIEIEEELRRIAHARQIHPSTTAIKMAQELVNAKVLPATLLVALKDILSICNQAVHGAEINSETALEVVNTGDQLLAQLHAI